MELVGVEPTTSAMPLQRSAKLSYSPISNEQPFNAEHHSETPSARQEMTTEAVANSPARCLGQS